MGKVFISYAHEDQDYAKKLYYDLRNRGVDAWIDIEDLLPGENWKYTINQTIKNCTHFLALLSFNSINKKGFVQKELKTAINLLDEIPDNEIYLIPIRLDDCIPVNELLHNLNWLDLYSSYDEGLNKLLMVLSPDDNSLDTPHLEQQNNKIEFEEFFFVGREEELQKLMKFATSSIEEKNGNILFVSGEAGIGKTYLVKEFLNRLYQKYKNIIITSGRCNLDNASYLPFRNILEKMLKIENLITINGKKYKTKDFVKETLLKECPYLLDFFEISIDFSKKKSKNWDIQESAKKIDLDQIKLFSWYVKSLSHISFSIPLVIFLDDLHWSDNSSLDLLFHIGREIADKNILLICTYRTNELCNIPSLVQLKKKLGRYGAKDLCIDFSVIKQIKPNKIRKFINDFLMAKYNTNFSNDFEIILMNHTRGNALFITEILKCLEESGSLIKLNASTKEDSLTLKQQNETYWKLTASINSLNELPEKIENAISERIDRLNESLRETIEYASVFGNDFIAQVIAKIQKIDERDLINLLTRKLMKEHGLVSERGGKFLQNGKRIYEFSFKHNLIREHIYSQLSDTDKEIMHTEIAESLEILYGNNKNEIASQLYKHFLLGQNLCKSLQYCLIATQNANLSCGPSEAVNLGKIGLDVLNQNSENITTNEFSVYRIQFLLEIAKGESLGGDSQEQKDHLQAGINCLEDNLELIDCIPKNISALVYMQLGKLYNRRNIIKLKAKQYLEKALDVFNELGDEKAIIETYYQLSFSDSYQKAIKMLEKGLQKAKKFGDTAWQIRILTRLSWETNIVCHLYAKNCSSEALKLSENSNKQLKCEALLAIAGTTQGYGKFKTVIKYLEKALKLSRETGNVHLEARVLQQLGHDYHFYINLQEYAIKMQEESISIKKRVGIGLFSSFSALGQIYITHGKWDEAERILKNANEGIDEKRLSYNRLKLGYLYFAKAEYDLAEIEFRDGYEILKNYPVSNFSLYSFECANIALNYAALNNFTKCEEFINITNSILKEETYPRYKWLCQCKLSEAYRLMKKYEQAKHLIHYCLTSFLDNAEDPEELVDVAEARLVLGKILFDLHEFKNAIIYLNKAKNGFEICKHYLLGETLKYLCKAYKSTILDEESQKKFPTKLKPYLGE